MCTFNVYIPCNYMYFMNNQQYIHVIHNINNNSFINSIILVIYEMDQINYENFHNSIYSNESFICDLFCLEKFKKKL